MERRRANVLAVHPVATPTWRVEWREEEEGGSGGSSSLSIRRDARRLQWTTPLLALHRYPHVVFTMHFYERIYHCVNFFSSSHFTLICANRLFVVLIFGSQGSGEEEDLDEDDSLSEDSGSELQDDLQDDSEQSFGKSQPTTPSPSPPATPRPTRRRRKPRSPSFSDDENRPPSPKVIKVTNSTNEYWNNLEVFILRYLCYFSRLCVFNEYSHAGFDNYCS